MHQLAVHPHACGDDWISLRWVGFLVGSPPRLWGRFPVNRHHGEQDRFTPTPVGTIVPALCVEHSTAVHPHACGDDGNMCHYIAEFFGSPPRLWGRSLVQMEVELTHRFTPTPVGTMRPAARADTSHPVHPHACGDDTLEHITCHEPTGSPPRLWGRLAQSSSSPATFRFTPTPVGTMCRRRPGPELVTVHPHACGDDVNPLQGKSSAIGSPPRLWGRCCRSVHTSCGTRFTPTPVGTMLSATA